MYLKHEAAAVYVSNIHSLPFFFLNLFPYLFMHVHTYDTYLARLHFFWEAMDNGGGFYLSIVTGKRQQQPMYVR